MVNALQFWILSSQLINKSSFWKNEELAGHAALINIRGTNTVH